MERGRDGWRVKKRAGRSCLLNHITVKGIALTLSPHCALSIPTNLLIDRRSSQTVPSSPAARAREVPWACLCHPTGCHREPRQQMIIQDAGEQESAMWISKQVVLFVSTPWSRGGTRCLLCRSLCMCFACSRWEDSRGAASGGLLNQTIKYSTWVQLT